jgi:hypothetical protein
MKTQNNREGKKANGSAPGQKRKGIVGTNRKK